MKTSLWLCLWLLLAGCASRDELAARLAAAMTPSALPALSACWESHFERAGFRGRYLAVVDFTLSPDGALHDVTVRALVDETGPEPGHAHEAGALRRCIADALDGATIAFTPSHALAVTGYRIALRDGTAEARASRERVLIGPRHDRCQGLFGYDPPRELGTLQRELERTAGPAAHAEGDALARALQQRYDLSLELMQRLALERRADLPPESDARIARELARVRQLARDVGARIGCRPD